jgi:hypothetical protein
MPLKVPVEDGNCLAVPTPTTAAASPVHVSEDTGSGSDPDQSDADEDLASQPWTIGLPPGLDIDEGALASSKRTPLRSQAERTPLRSQAALYMPLRSRAEVFVPNGVALAAPPKEDAKTTVMMNNVPLSYTCDSLIDLLESKGFSKWFDFVYLPINFAQMLGVGYAFVNLTTPERAEEFILAFEGFDGWASSFSKTACAMRWSHCQGLSENINRYRNSPLMSDEVPAFYKPVLLKDGVRIPFPKPTKQLRTLRRRKAKVRDGEDGMDMAKSQEE